MADHSIHQFFSFKVLYTILRVMILGYSGRSVLGILTLFPMMVAPVCHVGDPLQLTCTASVQFIRWSILQSNEQGTLIEATNSVPINSLDANQMSQRVVNSSTFTFVRSSPQRASNSPLISKLSIDSVNIGLNGTVVKCTGGNPMTLASSTIQIIDTNQNIQYTPTLSISEEQYGADNITVTVKWSQTEPAKQANISYSSTVVPFVSVIFIGSTSRQLTISYNTEYNLSIVASTPCRPNATAVIKLNYANCGHPELLFALSNDSNVPKVMGYDNLPIEGKTITFSCPPGSELIGPNSATCTDNGEWEPDPSQLMCNNTKGYTVL